MPHALSRRDALAGAVALLTAAPAFALPAEDKALVANAAAYLDGLSAVKSRFTQSDQRGDVASGVLYLARPGRARFQYNPPSTLLITCDGKIVTVSDSRLKTQQRVALRSTPLAIFLADHVRLDRGARVTRVDHYSPTAFAITAQPTTGITQGEMILYFESSPMRLTGWVVSEPQGRVTRVILDGLTPIATPPDDLFTQPAPPATGQM